MVERAWVEACYRVLLGREPESEAVVAEKARRIKTPEALLSEFLESEEGRARRRFAGSDDGMAPPAAIETDASDDERQALFLRLKAQWSALGDRDPYWSVLTHDEFRAGKIDAAALAAFEASGTDSAALVEAYAERNRVAVVRGTCLELGCGVGRVTRHLAKRFERVIGLDVSAGNLRVAEAAARAAGIGNIAFGLVESLERIEAIAPFDFFFSLLTLQHNPPPIQKALLDALLVKIRPGGGFLFQTQIHHPGYRFSVAEFLASPIDAMDMHSLPMREIFALVDKHGLRLREVVADPYTGRFGSYTFFGVRPDAEAR